MIAADAIVKCLELERSGMSSAIRAWPSLLFFNSILDTNIKTILVRQEQNAAHEASGYARITGKVGVAYQRCPAPRISSPGSRRHSRTVSLWYVLPDRWTAA